MIVGTSRTADQMSYRLRQMSLMTESKPAYLFPDGDSVPCRWKHSPQSWAQRRYEGAYAAA